MEHACFLRPEEIGPEARIGGKAGGLLRLYQADAPVPPWVVIPAETAAERPWYQEDRAARALQVLYSELDAGSGVAVRSSGLQEDGRQASAAGIYETHFCDRPLELPTAIEAVLASARTARADRYGAPGGNSTAMAVVIQRRVAPRLSGVLFSAHPTRAYPDRAYLEVVHGAGSALVDGEARPSHVEVDVQSGGVVTMQAGADGPEDLDGDFVHDLWSWLLKLEAAFEAALDIEWAIDDTGLWLLQARPVTRLVLEPSLRPAVPATSWFFDQRFTEPIRPLTRTSLLPRILHASLEEPLALRGQPVPEPLACDYAGQVYVNLEAYQRLLRNVPRWLLTPDLGQIFTAGARQGGFLPGVGLLWTGPHLLWRERRIVFGNVGAWEGFRDRLDAALAAIPAADPADATAWLDAWRRLDALTEEFLRIHRWSIVLADYGYNVFQCATAWLPAASRTRWWKRVLSRVRLITAEANTARAAALNSRDEKARAAFIARYGHRSGSLDYATPTWAELDFGVMPPGATASAAEPSGSGNSPACKPCCRWFSLVRLLEMREEQRFHWERVLARQRGMLLDAAQDLAKRGAIRSEADIWWMEWDEFVAVLQGGAPPDATILARRKREHRIYQPARRPPHLQPAGQEPGLAETGIAAPIGTTRGAADQIWQGTGASEGRAHGPALVCRHPTELPEAIPEGTILVLPALDPGWTPVLRQVAGLVTERGGLLSHAALIAREYGVPMVTGVAEATEVIQSGVELIVDGASGVVWARTGQEPSGTSTEALPMLE